MTIAEKILSAHAHKRVYPGEIAFCDVDYVMIPDGTGMYAVRSFYEMRGQKVFDKDKVMFVFGSGVPAPNERIANLQQYQREFAVKYGITLAEGGSGVCHQVMVEREKVHAGDLIIGGESHSCMYGALGAFGTGMGATDIAATLISGKNWFRVPETIRIDLKGSLQNGCSAKDIILRAIGIVGASGGNNKAFEFYGDYFETCSLDAKMTITSMIVDMGGDTGFTCCSQLGIEADPDAKYFRRIEIDLDQLEPSVAKPGAPDNWVPISEVDGTPFTYAFLGSCTNARYED